MGARALRFEPRHSYYMLRCFRGPRTGSYPERTIDRITSYQQLVSWFFLFQQWQNVRRERARKRALSMYPWLSHTHMFDPEQVPEQRIGGAAARERMILRGFVWDARPFAFEQRAEMVTSVRGSCINSFAIRRTLLFVEPVLL